MIMAATATLTVSVDGIGAVPVACSDRGTGHPFLLLHGGAGPQSVTGFADQLAEDGTARVVTPVHPGFAGTPRPGGLNSVAGLARLYVSLLDGLGLDDVTVVGNSIGGWIGAEMALAGSARISGVVLVDACGIEVPGHPVADFFALTLDQVAELSYHDPGPFRIDPAAMSAGQRAVMAGNRGALAVYGEATMTDPGLRARLGRIAVPALVLWGDSDRIVDPDYGRAYAAAIPGAQFRLLPATGHVPQIETPAQLLGAIRDFAAARAAAGRRGAGATRPADPGPGLAGPLWIMLLRSGTPRRRGRRPGSPALRPAPAPSRPRTARPPATGRRGRPGARCGRRARRGGRGRPRATC
jgi:pimeloyl-ACP methyl ester carboxylesterase